MLVSVDRVTAGDEAALAHIQTESWKAAFAGILFPETLARCTELQRATTMYARLIAQGKGNGYILRVNGEPHCIAWWDAARDEDMPGWAELICIHSLPERWRQGLGSRMMETVLRDAAAAGYRQMMLWVFRENHRARRFYERYGFVPSDAAKESMGAVEIRYEKRW